MEVSTATPHSFDLHPNMPLSYTPQLEPEPLPLSSPIKDPIQGERNMSHAALKLQKVYRSYQTRRRLADSAVVAEELWWQVIDFARLNHSTVSFFNFQKPETAHSRWNRITLNASKVGKGLSKDEKSRKLAFQHWIEAIDPRHRYGHNLHRYYDVWYQTNSSQPFFYWLDIGDGRDVEVKECPRSLLKQQCVKYLGPQEREHYEYVAIDGKIVHKQTGELLDTTKGCRGAKWIFVMSSSKKLYAGQKRKGIFHHSSFLAGGTIIAAGRLIVENGMLKCVWAYSGHYKPTDENLDIFMTFLRENGINLNEVQVRTSNDDEYYEDQKGDEEQTDKIWLKLPKAKQMPDEIADQLIPNFSIAIATPKAVQIGEIGNAYQRTLSGGLKSPRVEVPKTKILERINSKNTTSSYQLGKQLSRKWSTGAGPRIGCVLDYPLELRVQALEISECSPRISQSPFTWQQIANCTSPIDSTSPRCGPQSDQRSADVALEL